MNTTSESLLIRLRSPDDQQAWAKFVEIYTPLIFYWARRTGLQQNDAADLVQEVFAQLVQKLPEFRYQKHKSFRGWLRRVTVNKRAEQLRRKTLTVVDESPSQFVDISSQNAEQFWEHEYKQQLVQRYLQLMEPDFDPKTWKALRDYLLGAPAAKAAQAYGVSIWTVYSAKSRVLSRLRTEIGDFLD